MSGCNKHNRKEFKKNFFVSTEKTDEKRECDNIVIKTSF